MQQRTFRTALAVIVIGGIAAISLIGGADPKLLGRGALDGAGGIVVVGAYFLPTLIAYWRNHPSRNAIAILNITVGWTIIGWGVAMIWAVAWGRPILAARHPCPHCAEAILPAATVCRYCGSALRPGWAEGAEILPMPRQVG
jgi:hypothetical protein